MVNFIENEGVLEGDSCAHKWSEYGPLLMKILKKKIYMLFNFVSHEEKSIGEIFLPTLVVFTPP